MQRALEMSMREISGGSSGTENPPAASPATSMNVVDEEVSKVLQSFAGYNLMWTYAG